MDYDGIRRPTQLLTEDSSMNLIIGFEHDYDAEDNKVNERKLHDLSNSELYSYDSAYRLTTFDRGNLDVNGTAITTPTTTPNTLQLRDWTLDGVGNWQALSSSLVPLSGIGGPAMAGAIRQHTNFNEIVNETGDAPSTTFDHDDNGNLLTDDTFDYQWDALNRLRTVTRIADGLTIATYTYDCQNRRMRKEVTNSGSRDGTTDYYYSGWRVCAEYDFNGSTETLKYQYVWGATYHDELIARDDRQGGTTIAQLNDGAGFDRQFQHHNTLFSVFAVTDETGDVLERYQYDPYGNQTVMDANFNGLASSNIDQEFTYTGQRFDAETNLCYYKNRYYSPNKGRFISRDPIGYEDGVNLYRYVKDSPINYIDIIGLFRLPRIPGMRCLRAFRSWRDAVDEGERKCAWATDADIALWDCIFQAVADGRCCPGSSLPSDRLEACGRNCRGELNRRNLARRECALASAMAAARAGQAARACGWPL